VIKKGSFMMTKVIEDQDLLDILQKAIEFEEIKLKPKSCFYLKEKFQFQIVQLCSRVKSWQDHIDVIRLLRYASLKNGPMRRNVPVDPFITLPNLYTIDNIVP
jgi:hypothetical protein